MRTKRFLSILLSLVLVLGMLPGMSLTASAADNPTEITPTNTSGTMTITLTIAAAQAEKLLTTITATGEKQANYNPENFATVSFSYTAGGSSAYRANWGWWGYGWSATVNAAEGYTITKCVFYDDEDRTATDSEAPFVVETTEEDKTPRVNGTPILANTSKGITKIEVYGYATPASSYSVTITPGDNMTKTADSGETSQTDLSGAMTEVVYTADNGYYFPEDYAVTAVNGISVTLNGYTQITVSGTPTADAEITLTAPTAKTTPAAPAAPTKASATKNSITLTAVDGCEYKLGDGGWQDGTEFTGLTPSTEYTFYQRIKATETANASASSPAAPISTAADTYGMTIRLVIKPAQTITASDVTATYGDTDKSVSASVTEPTTGGGEISYAVKEGSEEYISVDATTGALTINKAGTATVTVTAAETDTYAATTKDVTVTVNTKAMTVSASGYTGYVDQTAHGIIVTVTDPSSGYTVKYGETQGTYNLNTSPTQTEVGEKTVYYQVTADNYTTYTGSATITVNAKQTQTITAENVTATYGDTGKSVSALTNGGGTLSYAVKAGSEEYISVDATTGALTINKAGTATVTVTAAETQTYAPATKEVTVTINKAAGTISYATASVSKTYGDAAFTNELTKTGDGIVNYTSDNTAVATVNVETGEVAIVGTGEATIRATVTDGTNYTYDTKTATYAITVNAAAMTVSATGYTGTYDGESHTVTVTAPEGATVKYGTEEGNRTLDAAPAYTNAGTYTVYYEVTKQNYTTVTGSATVTISQAALTVTANDKSKTYGDADPELTATVEGAVGTDTINYTLSRAEGQNVGEYAITVTLGENPNYDVTATNAKFTIGKKAATVTAADKSKTYGEDDPELTATVEGTVGNDTINYTLSRAEGQNVDEYAITVTLGENPNYDVTATNAKFTIGKKAATVIAADKSKTYGADDPELTATVEGTVGNDTINYTLSRTEGQNVGEYAITVTLGENPNYDVTVQSGTFSITKAALTITAKDQSIYIGQSVPEWTEDSYTVTGLLGEDALDTPPGVKYRKDGQDVEVDVRTVGAYDIVPCDAADANYDITYVSAALTINYWPASDEPAQTVTVPVSGDEETVNVTVSVSGNTATVTGADVEKVLEAEDVGTVTIDVSALNENVTEAVIPGAMMEKIADAVADESNNADGLEIKLPTGAVTFDAEAVAAISEQANGKDLRLNLEDIGENKLNTAQKSTVEDMDVQAVLDAYMTADGKRISDFKGGKATVSVSYILKDGQAGRGVIVWYVAEDGEKTEVPTTYNDKTVSFTVGHFSNYVIAYDAERAAECTRDKSCPMSSFTDLNLNEWYHDGIHFCLENGLMVGAGDNRFNPDGATSRAMVVAILYRLEGEPKAAAANPFEDVAEGDWYTDAVIWAAENNIVSGYDNGKFGPDDNITREQLAAILYRYAQFKEIDVSVGADTNILDFADAGAWSDWSVDALQWAVGSGIIQGKDGKLVPKGDASRAEAATMLQRFCEVTK